MTRALAWVRKSKGDEDDIGLQKQREEVFALADELADDVDKLDLGVQTGFSTLSRDGDGLINQQEEVQNAREKLETGEYDYLVAWDDRRVCRDEYYAVIKLACDSGNVDRVFVADIDEGDMGHEVRRKVEEHVKQEEIEKARAAVNERLERGYDHGRPPFGFEYDDEGKHWVPNEKFETARNIIHAIEERGETWAEVRERTGASDGAIDRILKNKDRYMKGEQEA